MHVKWTKISGIGPLNPKSGEGGGQLRFLNHTISYVECDKVGGVGIGFFGGRKHEKRWQ